MTKAKASAIFALAVLLADPPPKVVGSNQPERALCRSLLESASKDSVAVPFKNNGILAGARSEKLHIARLVEAADRLPGLVRNTHIFRVAIGPAFRFDFDLEDIQQRDLFPVRITSFQIGRAHV